MGGTWLVVDKDWARLMRLVDEAGAWENCLSETALALNAQTSLGPVYFFKGPLCCSLFVAG